MADKDYYDILGLKSDCSDAEIKKAYRKLAMEYHPDKHMADSPKDKKIAEDKFKEINNAYEILGDQSKRKRYDQFGNNDFTSQGYHFNNASDVFNTFFQSFGANGFSDFARFNGFNENGSSGFMDGKQFHMKFNNMRNSMENVMNSGIFGNFPDFDSDSSDEIVKDDPIYVDLLLTLEELYKGCSKGKRISRTIYTGTKNKKEVEDITINVQSGWRENTRIKFHNKGDVYPNRDPADIIFIVKQKPHNIFTRDDNDLVTTIEINTNDIKNVIKREIPGIDGEPLSITIPKNTIKDSNYVYTIPKRGMPIRKEGKNIGRGDVLVKFLIKF